MDSNATKARKKMKFFPCFRSGGSVRTEQCDDATDKAVFTYIAGEEMDGVGFPAVPPVANLSSDGDGDDEDEDKDPVHRKNKGGGGVFSRALRAVLLETSLAKKIRKRKSKQKPNSVNRNSKKESQRCQALSSKNNRRTVSDAYFNSSSSSSSSRTSAPLSSSSLCSSYSSSSGTDDRSFRSYLTASRPVSRQRNLRKINLADSGWFLLLICLLSLAFWGKAGAVVCTSAWILFLPRRSVGFKSSGDNSNEAEIDSREFKKRIVIEGLLARDRSAAHGPVFRID